jgi:hypothetical protein
MKDSGNPSAADSGQGTKEWVRQNWIWCLAYLLVLAFFLVRWLYHPGAGPQENGWDRFLAALASSLIVLWAVAFVHVFTTPLPLPPSAALDEATRQKRVDADDETKKWQRRNWMVFSYSFMLLSLLGVVFLFSAGWDQSRKTLGQADAPIAVFVGCSLSDEPKELACFPKVDNAKEADTKPPAAGAKPASTPPAAGSLAADVSKPRSAFVLNIGGHVMNRTACSGESPTEACQVRGGLLVPLYVIILALIGGSISLTRRLPEYQVRASSAYLPTEKEPKLSQHQMREYLVFQIVQFISAPLIAVLAYYLAAPDKTSTAVVLAFTAGFASEAILLMVRAMADKVSPGASSAPQFGTITGVLTHDGKAVAQAEVSIAAHPQLRTLTDDCGHYVLGNVPVGEHGLKIVKDTPKLELTETVRIERAQAVVTKNVVSKKP